jgi:glutathione S-transferase
VPKIQLLGGLVSPFTRKVRIVFAEKNIPYEMLPGPTEGEDNPVIPHNPLGKIPVVIVDGRQTIHDSSVIAEYLDMLVPTPALLPPVGMDRVMVKRWESLADGICDAGVACMGEKRRTENRSQEYIVRQRNKFERGIAAAARELGDREWCHGQGLTLADIAIVTAVAYIEFRFPDCDWRKRHPNLHALHERLVKRPAFAETRPREPA